MNLIKRTLQLVPGRRGLGLAVAAAALSPALTVPAQARTSLVGIRAEIPADVKLVIAELQTAFSAFKEANDLKLQAKADVVVAEKIDRINSTIADLQAAVDAANMKLAAKELQHGQRPLADAEYSKAFNAHFRGHERNTSVEVMASLNKGTASEGGYLTPIEWDRTVTDKLVAISPMRQIAQVITIGNAGFRKLFNLHGTGSGWVGETAARPETTGPAFGPMDFVPGEIYANPAATQGMLDDAQLDIEAWLAGEVETEFEYQEGIAFVSGNGTNKPYGFLTFATGAANAAVNPFGAILVGVTAASATAITFDELIDLQQSLPQAMQGGARFVANRNTVGAIRKLKDGNGNYLWQPSVQQGTPATILNAPVTEMPAMPNPAANALPIAYGDFRRGYLIVDRTGVRVLRDPFTNKPFVMFYTTKRVGGGVQNPEAIKVLKMAAS